MLTVSTAIARYQRERAESVPGSVGRIIEMAKAVKAIYAKLPAGSFGGKQLKRVRFYLLTNRTCRWNGQQLSRTYANQLISTAVQCWTWLLSEGLVGARCVAQLQAVTPLGHGQGGREPVRIMPPPRGWERVLHTGAGR